MTTDKNKMEEIEESEEVKPTRVINHKTMRIVIGVIATLMPYTVLLLAGHPVSKITSISLSYWTQSHDIFVGSLVAVAFFLLAYNGTGDCKKGAEFWLSKFSCGFAIAVAIFPTKCSFDGCNKAPPNWVLTITDAIHIKPHIIHYIAAGSLFFCLMLMMFIFSIRAKHKGAPSRAKLYSSISLGMLIGMPIIYLVGKYTKWYEPLFWVELAGLMLFGIGWLKAGWYKAKPDPKLPGNAVMVKELKIDPGFKNFPTNIDVKKGEKYIFEAKGCWGDWFLECGPQGWGPSWGWLTSNNRVRNQPFFLLCGNVGENDGLAFCIGRWREWEVPSTVNELESENQKLFLFANDRKTEYWNNKTVKPKEGGPLKVAIYRLISK